MATKSFLKNIDIKDRDMARSFVSALENSENKKSKDVVLKRTCQEIKSEKIKAIFGNK